MRRRWLAFLLFGVLTAQTLGLVHRVAHFPLQLASVATSSVLAPSAAPSGWRALFSAHSDDAGCLLFDQLCYGGSFGAHGAIVPALVVALFLLPILTGQALARRAELFEARGPPFPV
jgi:hypothetical protein